MKRKVKNISIELIERVRVGYLAHLILRISEEDGEKPINRDFHCCVKQNREIISYVESRKGRVDVFSQSGRRTMSLARFKEELDNEVVWLNILSCSKELLKKTAKTNGSNAKELLEEILTLEESLSKKRKVLEKFQKSCDHIFGPEQQDSAGWYKVCTKCGHLEELGSE